MMPWFPIRKRKGNAVLFGRELKEESPKINIIIDKPTNGQKVYTPRFLIVKGKNDSK
jgi:hypothetical protein